MESKVWATLEDGNIKIVSLSKQHLEDSKKLIIDYYLNEELISVITGVHKNPVAANEVFEFFRLSAEEGCSLAVIDESKGKLVGVCINSFEDKDCDPTYIENLENVCHQKESQNFMRIEDTLWKSMDVCDLMKTDSYIDIGFTVVLPEYRRRGIMGKLLEVMIVIAKRLHRGEDIREIIGGESEYNYFPKMGALFGVFTSPISGSVAIKLGFEKIKSAKIGNYTGNLRLPEEYLEKEIHFMALRINA